MAQLRDETQSSEAQNEETQSAARYNDRDVFPPTYPALPRLRTGRLHFAPAPVREMEETTVSTRRTQRVDWVECVFEAGWMALGLGCSAECVYRLLWAVQP